MKVRTDRRSHGVVVELERGESELPPVALPEVKLKRLLVPVDFSDCSRKALHYAISFAKQFSSEVMLLHVVEALPPTPELSERDTEAVRAEVHEEAAKELSSWRASVVSKASVKAIVREGTPYREIVAAADEDNVDLIIIGTHGRTGMAHLLMGSTTERVVRHARCPVLVVREREHDFVP